MLHGIRFYRRNPNYGNGPKAWSRRNDAEDFLSLRSASKMRRDWSATQFCLTSHENVCSGRAHPKRG